MKSENVECLMLVLGKAQKLFKTVIKSKTNTYYKSKYADLDDIIQEIQPIFAEVGITWTQEQTFHPSEGWILQTCLWFGNQYLCSMTPILPKDKTAPSYGAALTYARRQGLQTLIGISADEDLDGQDSSMGQSNPQTTGKAGEPSDEKKNEEKSVTDPHVKPFIVEKQESKSYPDSVLATIETMEPVKTSKAGKPYVNLKISFVNEHGIKTLMQAVAFNHLASDISADCSIGTKVRLSGNIKAEIYNGNESFKLFIDHYELLPLPSLKDNPFHEAGDENL